MPGTLVFRASSGGRLQQVQVGATDLITTFSAARSVWGWLVGLAGTKHLLSSLCNSLHEDPFRGLQLPSAFKTPGIRCHILTSQGMLFFDDDDGHNAFGGDPTVQGIGLTLCALAHECGGITAVSLFIEVFVTRLLQQHKDLAALKETFAQHLNDNINVIVHEGAARGLTQIFQAAVADLPPSPRRSQYTADLPENSETNTGYWEMGLLAGLLEWLCTEKRKTYFTRSSLTARSASYLRAVGYPIGPIVVWDGTSTAPRPDRGLVLVLGGSFDTDTHAIDANRIYSSEGRLQLYFRQETISSMFLNSIGFRTDVVPETLQSFFSMVRDSVRRNCEFSWDTREVDVGTDDHRWFAKAIFSKKEEVARARIIYLCDSQHFTFPWPQTF